MKTIRHSVSFSHQSELQDIFGSSKEEPSDLIIGFGNAQGVEMLADSGMLASKAKRWLIASSCQTVLCDQMPDENLPSKLALLEFTDAKGSYGIAAKSCNYDNAFEQAKQFSASTDVSSLAITKLDGTAKGGVVMGISDQFKIPVKYIGVGEAAEDLQIFHADTFVSTFFS